ncbi:hypothetical protein RclHR1_07940003 [Rhizophagus clarus]|uniref:Uncharacterized protein n=1 Tax=Rhizophagus clarus TaxID=94130 RepID=A0A2Z6RZ44_9GLOM|nr:hypothetical protein RclHR1_07940003 [Rhizophagus clarus]
MDIDAFLFLQIGSDIFVDTKMILEELERRYPEPSIYPKRNGSDKSDRGIGFVISIWADSYFYGSTFNLLPFGSKDSSTPKIFTTKEFTRRSFFINRVTN